MKKQLKAFSISPEFFQVYHTKELLSTLLLYSNRFETLELHTKSVFLASSGSRLFQEVKLSFTRTPGNGQFLRMIKGEA